MKKPSYYISTLSAAALFVAAGDLSAQSTTVTEKQIQTSSGTGSSVTVTKGSVTEFTPGSQTVYIRSTTSPEPVRYAVTEQTTIVDQAGQPVAIETIRAGVPAEVHYVTTGDSTVASRIVVNTTAATAPAPVAVPAPAPVTSTEKTTTTTSRPITTDEIDAEQERLEEKREAEDERLEKLREAAEEAEE